MLQLRVRLVPRGGRDRIDGWADDGAGGRVLKARVAAPPVDGATNAALVRLLSTTLGVPRSAVAIVAGARARLKAVAVQGDPDTVVARLAALPGG